MIVSKDKIRRTVAGLAVTHPGASAAELHHRAAAALGIEADMVRIVMEEAARQETADSEN